MVTSSDQESIIIITNSISATGSTQYPLPSLYTQSRYSVAKIYHECLHTKYTNTE